jgi:hypothetical protein
MTFPDLNRQFHNGIDQNLRESPAKDPTGIGNPTDTGAGAGGPV